MPVFRSLALLLLLSLPLAAAATEASPLAGTWRFDPAGSTELSPWKNCTLTIRTEGDRVAIHRALNWGRRVFTDNLTVVPGRTETVAVEMWPDNRHLGAYISDNHTERVHTEWLDGRRILRLSTDLVLSTQQGDRAVNILSDYKVTGRDDLLILTELRSTRDRPIVYRFRRVAQP